jgi:glucose/mannose transport system substrate-binding protein
MAALRTRLEDAFRRVGRWTAALLARCVTTLLGTVGCSAQTSEPVTLDVYTWWQEPSEQRAIETVLTMFTEQHGVEVDPRYNSTAPTSRAELTRLLLNKAPPSTFHANVGADLLRWTVFDYHRASADDPENFSELGSMNFLHGLGDLFAAEGFYDPSVLPPDLLEVLRPRQESEPYGVPLSIHRLNVVYYNVERVAAKIGTDELTLDHFCPATGAPTVDLSIAVGIANPFSLTLLIFENLLPALEGGAFYEALFTGNPPVGWEARVRRTLECAQRLLAFNGGQQLSWGDAADRVATGHADLTVMGDWVSRKETVKTALENGTVKAMPFPSKQKLFVYTSDAFPLPIGGPYPDETKALLRTMMAPDVQIEFSKKKGSIPARSDIPLERLSEEARATKLDFETSYRVLATSGLFPSYYPDSPPPDDSAPDGSLEGFLTKIATGDEPEKAIDDVIQLLSDSQVLLAYWNERKRAGGDP